MKIFNKKVIIVGITIILLIISGGIYAFMNFNDDEYVDSENNNLLVNETISEKNQSIKIKVEIKGEVISPGVYEFDEARRSADILLMKADFNKENTELTLTLTTPDYMSKETAEKLKPFLRRPIVYHWKNGAFTK